jgi:hypothetical protein
MVIPLSTRERRTTVDNASPSPSGSNQSPHGDTGHHSLEYYRGTSTGTATFSSAPRAPVSKVPPCPNMKGFYFLDEASGAVIPARCGRNTCPSCARANAYRIGMAVAMAEPRWSIHITKVGHQWATVQRHVNRIVEYVRRPGNSLVMAWFVEHDPHGEDHHVHGYGRADDIGYETWQATAKAVGTGSIHIQKRRSDTREPVLYGLKTVLRGTDDDVREFLDLNGGRLVHASRGFWRDRRARPTTLRIAMKEAAQRLPGHWVLTNAHSDDPSN